MDTEEESERGEGEVDPPGRSPKGIVHVEGDLTPLTIGKRGLVWIFPWICVPVFAGSLWRLTAFKKRVTPGWGSPGKPCLAASLASSGCEIN